MGWDLSLWGAVVWVCFRYALNKGASPFVYLYIPHGRGKFVEAVLFLVLDQRFLGFIVCG